MSQGQRALIAGVLSLAVLLLWQEFYLKRHLPPEPPSVEAPIPSAGSNNTPTPGISPYRTPEVQKPVDNELVHAVWSSHGGVLKEFLLKRYQQGVEKRSPPINLLSLEGERGLSLICSDCNFALPAEDSYRLIDSSPSVVTFEGENKEILVRKEFHLSDYAVDLTVSIKDLTGKGSTGRLGLSWEARQYPEEKKGFLGFLKRPGNKRSFVSLVEGTVHRSGKEGTEQMTGTIPWVGIDERYFLITLISRQLSSSNRLQTTYSGDRLSAALFPDVLTIPSGGVVQEKFSAYLGPKDLERLSMTGVGLEQEVDYGWFKFLGLPMLKLLQIGHQFARNWGIAIILLTVLVKLLMNPLTIKSMKQMKEMQKLQPRLAELKEKFQNDKQRLNMETMQLFKTHKVNPMGGCLPMILQMPLYIALYKVLYNAIELYHAPFFGFYRDLSAPDPYFILPILLGASMFLQQKLTPSPSADPAQRQMMMIMPIMFTSFMLFLPLGLVLYIFINTASSVLQQWMYQRGIRWRDLVKLQSMPARPN